MNIILKKYLLLFLVLSVLLPHNILSQKEFYLDTTINSILILKNINSVNNFCAKIDSSMIIDNENNMFNIQHFFILFLNKSKTEYLAAIIHEGTWNNYFSEFEIGRIIDTTLEIINLPYIITNYKDFKTESGIGLGVTFDSLKQIKGEDYSVINNKLKYCFNSLDSEFLEYGGCEYYFECEIKNDKIIRIRFGYSPM